MDSGDRFPRTPITGPAALSWSRTVEREFVHRVSVAEVLLTDVRAVGDDRFEAAACWPRSHPTFPRGRDDRHSPLVVVETLRQLGIYLPLRHYGVLPGTRFLIKDFSFAIDPAREPRAGHGATEVTCAVSVAAVRGGPAGAPRGMRMRVRFLAGEVPFARAEGEARFLGTVEYTALRGTPGEAARSAVTAVRPEHLRLDVASPFDVVLGVDRDALVLDPVDARHPFLFDHGADHVPGMALLEAARQAAAMRSAGRLVRPVAGRMKALRFTEHTPYARVESAFYLTTCVFRFRQGAGHTAVGVFRYA